MTPFGFRGQIWVGFLRIAKPLVLAFGSSGERCAFPFWRPSVFPTHPWTLAHAEHLILVFPVSLDLFQQHAHLQSAFWAEFQAFARIGMDIIQQRGVVCVWLTHLFLIGQNSKRIKSFWFGAVWSFFFSFRSGPVVFVKNVKKLGFDSPFLVSGIEHKNRLWKQRPNFGNRSSHFFCGENEFQSFFISVVCWKGPSVLSSNFLEFIFSVFSPLSISFRPLDSWALALYAHMQEILCVYSYRRMI